MTDLLEAVKLYAEWHGACHEKDCPGDDTCNCKGKPINEAINNAVRLADYQIARDKTEALADTLCYCCHHLRRQCPHCAPRLSGLDKLLHRGNAQPSSVCQCNGSMVE